VPGSRPLAGYNADSGTVSLLVLVGMDPDMVTTNVIVGKAI
jgi:hypothetical protein